MATLARRVRTVVCSITHTGICTTERRLDLEAYQRIWNTATSGVARSHLQTPIARCLSIVSFDGSRGFASGACGDASDTRAVTAETSSADQTVTSPMDSAGHSRDAIEPDAGGAALDSQAATSSQPTTASLPLIRRDHGRDPRWSLNHLNLSNPRPVNRVAQEIVKRLRELRQEAPVARVLDMYEDIVIQKCISEVLVMLGKGPPSGRNLLLHVMDWVRSSDHVRVQAFHYGAVISALAGWKDWSAALQVHAAMRDDHLAVGPSVYSALIFACGWSGQIKHARQVFEGMRAAGVHRDVTAYNNMITACRKCFAWEEAWEVLRLMQRDHVAPNTATFECLTMACASAGQPAAAAEAVRAMRAAGHPPTTTTFNNLISAHGNAGDWEGARDALDLMAAEGVHSDSYTFNALIHAAGKCRRWEEVERQLHVMEAERIPTTARTYNMVMRAAEACGKWEAAIGMLDRMRQERVLATTTTYNNLLMACAQ
eukprot:CAMPEP_0118960500 /NCGR_PEP_ID=MMETSP1169-20130426/63671_1 /TAXON_ID=36882 /ORGANISM="Pyramimonas obovata, Strain CCMP722" /LENGTH=484 /DNA_ID=CAMNT_0006908649 /DNA_START=108 /DNA_END=1559 /DNA_ORIENTATION=-